MKRAWLACLLASLGCEAAPLREREFDRQVVLAEGEERGFSLGDAVHVVVRGPARYLVRGERELLLGEGLASVDVAGTEVRAGQRTFSLATPGGHLVVPFAARLAVRAHAVSELVLVSGEALVDETLLVRGSKRVCFTEAGPHALTMPELRRLDTALDELRGAEACKGEQAPSIARAQRELARELDVIERDKAAQAALLARRAADPQAPLSVREVARLGQSTYEARTRALMWRARLWAEALRVGSGPSALLERAEALENPAR